MVTSYRPYGRPRGSEPHIDLVDSEPHIDLVDDGPEDWLPHIDHILGPEGQNLI